MVDQAEFKRFRRCRLFARGVSVAAMGIGISVLAGWLLDLPVLKSVLPGGATMKPFTALSFILAGLSLWLLSAAAAASATPSTRRLTLARICSMLVVLIGLLTLVEYLTGINLWFERLLFPNAVATPGELYPGRMAPVTALGFLLLGSALICLLTQMRRDWPLDQLLALGVILLGGIALEGYLFDVAALYRIFAFGSVALHTAVLFILLGTGVLFARPDAGIAAIITRQATGGQLARRLLPLVILLPLIGGWLRWQGELFGWYSTAFGLALFVALNIIVLTAVVWIGARQLNRVDDQRISSARSKAENESRLSAIIDSAMDAIITVDEHQQILIFNPAAEKMFDCAEDEALGQPLSRFIPERFRATHLDHVRAFGQARVSRRRMGELGAIYGLRADGTEFPIEASISQAEAMGQKIFTVILRDITERQRAEAISSQLAALIESSDDAIIGKSLDGIILSWNPGAERLFGYTSAEVLGQPMLMLFPPSRAAEEADILARIAGGERIANVETVRLHKDGTKLFLSATISPVKDGAGRIVGISTIARDITARKHAEAALRQQASLLDLAPVLVRDLDDRIIFWSRGIAQLYGYTTEEAIGRLSHELLRTEFPEPREQIEALFQQAGFWEGELLQRKRDGSRITVTSQWLVYRDETGKPARILEVSTDVTDLRLVEEELRMSQHQLRAALDASGMGVWVLDLQADRMWLDDVALQLWGLTREEAADGNRETLTAMIHPDDQARMVARTSEVLKSQKASQVEFRVVHPDGSVRWLASKGQAELNAAGQPLRRTGVLMDITERRREEDLHRRSQKLEALGTLAGGIAHDFNNMLLAISGNAQLAGFEVPADHPVQESLTEITKASARATDLVQRILAFSRPQEHERKPTDLKPVIEEALRLVRATTPAMIEIRATFAPDVPPVSADATQLHQIIVNLTTNAAHAIGSRSGLIQLRLNTVEVSAELAETFPDLSVGPYVQLTISDNGCGMDRATMERIFDPFFTTKPPGAGTGLGLSVVHGILKIHEGAIRVYSEVGKGTEFKVYFPAITAAVIPAAPATQAATRTGSGHVLYVDDEESLIFLATRMLERLGYKVTGYTDPFDALKAFSAQPEAFDVVVTDLSMPKLTGFDLAREILATRPDTPIIITSGYLRPEDQEAAAQMGIREMILKPDTIKELGVVLDRLLKTAT